MTSKKQYWLLKTEPSDYSIQDLAAEPNQSTCWDGVRNYQARNTLRDQMSTGDEVLLYHSNANPPAIVGVAIVKREGYPDPTAWDETNSHFDPKSTPENPRWFMVDIKLKRIFKCPLPLPQLREEKSLTSMELLKKGSRLSVQPVTADEFKTVISLSD